MFAVSRMLSWMAIPLAYFLAGPTADRIFEPMLLPGGALAGSVGQVIGVGEGRGIALMFVLAGALTLFATLGAYLYPPVREIEQQLPDNPPDEPLPPVVVEQEMLVPLRVG